MAGTSWNRAGTGALKLTWLATRGAGAVSARAAGWPAARLWFTPWQVPLSERARARELAWLEATESLEVPWRGRRLAGFSAGGGPAVLLVHGWGERASALGAFVAPLVEAGYRAVAVDLPGHGRSPGGQTNALEIAAALHATSEAVGGIDAVIAHSMGGHATMLALSEGLPARAAVLLAPAVRLEHGLGKFGELFRLPPRAIEGLRSTIERRFGSTVWHDLAADRLVLDIDECEALIFHDEDDPQVDPEDARLLQAAWPGAHLVTTTGLGHNKLVRDADVVERAISFLTTRLGSVDQGREPSWERFTAS